MTAVSSNPMWAELVRTEMQDDKETAERLVDGLEKSCAIFQEMFFHLPPDDPPRQKAEARIQLEKTQNRIQRLRGSLDHIGKTAKLNLALGAGRVAVRYEDSTGRVFHYMRPAESLSETLDFCELVFDEAIETLRKSRGHPVSEDRDFLVGLVSVAFRHEAPEQPRTHEITSLFYQVVAQLESDLGIGEENLSRRIERVLSATN